jgi:hypothetical protein
MGTPVINATHDDSRILTVAVAKVADLWGLSNAKLGAVLGLSPATASRLRSKRARRSR